MGRGRMPPQRRLPAIAVPRPPQGAAFVRAVDRVELNAEYVDITARGRFGPTGTEEESTAEVTLLPFPHATAVIASIRGLDGPIRNCTLEHPCAPGCWHGALYDELLLYPDAETVIAAQRARFRIRRPAPSEMHLLLGVVPDGAQLAQLQRKGHWAVIRLCDRTFIVYDDSAEVACLVDERGCALHAPNCPSRAAACAPEAGSLEPLLDSADLDAVAARVIETELALPTTLPSRKVRHASGRLLIWRFADGSAAPRLTDRTAESNALMFDGLTDLLPLMRLDGTCLLLCSGRCVHPTLAALAERIEMRLRLLRADPQRRAR